VEAGGEDCSRPGSVLLVRYVLPLFSLTDGDPDVFLSCFSGEILICNLAYRVHVYRTALGPAIIMSSFFFARDHCYV
jgi:hypothetical protein